MLRLGQRRFGDMTPVERRKSRRFKGVLAIRWNANRKAAREKSPPGDYGISVWRVPFARKASNRCLVVSIESLRKPS
jgi:hypothetical protein